jgi:arsenate reductase (glutaredoxin)
MAPNPAVPAAAPRVQIFGLEKDQATRAAIRFFKERRAEVHLVDLRRKPISPGELRRFVQKLGAEALLDTAGRI